MQVTLIHICHNHSLLGMGRENMKIKVKGKSVFAEHSLLGMGRENPVSMLIVIVILKSY